MCVIMYEACTVQYVLIYLTIMGQVGDKANFIGCIFTHQYSQSKLGI